MNTATLSGSVIRLIFGKEIALRGGKLGAIFITLLSSAGAALNLVISFLTDVSKL